MRPCMKSIRMYFFQMEVDCHDSDFPGIGNIISELSSWGWTFGRTPPFTLSHTSHDCHVTLTTHKGIITNVTIQHDSVTTDMRVSVPFCPILASEILGKENRLSKADITAVTEAILSAYG